MSLHDLHDLHDLNKANHSLEVIRNVINRIDSFESSDNFMIFLREVSPIYACIIGGFLCDINDLSVTLSETQASFASKIYKKEKAISQFEDRIQYTQILDSMVIFALLSATFNKAGNALKYLAFKNRGVTGIEKIEIAAFYLKSVSEATAQELISEYAIISNVTISFARLAFNNACLVLKEFEYSKKN